MKTKLLLLTALLAVSFQFINAQCSRTATINPTTDPTNYPVSGTANLTFYVNGTKEITFNNDFATVQGLDLRVYLSTNTTINSGGTDLEITSSPLIDDNGNPGGNTYLGDPLTGAKTFTVPSSVAFDEYDYIIIQCIQASLQWGRANLPAASSATGAECSTLSVEENTLLQALNFYPNPTNDVITINNDKQLDISIEIYDILGKKVLQTKSSSIRKQTINLSSLKTGVYLTQIKAGSNSITKKLVKQ